jgi:hypothetical protein
VALCVKLCVLCATDLKKLSPELKAFGFTSTFEIKSITQRATEKNHRGPQRKIQKTEDKRE